MGVTVDTLEKGMQGADGKTSHKLSMYSTSHIVHNYAVAIFLLANVIIFIWGKALVVGDLHAMVTITPPKFLDVRPGELDVIVKQFTFISVFRLARDAGQIGVAVVIFAVTGVWGFLKVVLSGVCWFVPMKAFHREWLLWINDQLGKFSYVFLFLIVIGCTAFTLDRELIAGDILKILGNQNLPGFLKLLPLDEVLVHVKTAMDTSAGLYLYIIGGVMSIIITQHITTVHFKREGYFKSTSQGTSTQIHKALLVPVILVGSFLSFSLFVYGMTLPIFTLHYGGMLGFMLTGNLSTYNSSLNLIGNYSDTSSREFSLVSVGTRLPAVAYNPFDVGPCVLAMFYFWFCVVSPLMRSISIAFTWTTFGFKFSTRVRTCALITTQYLGAWAASEVVLLGFGMATGLLLPSVIRYMLHVEFPKRSPDLARLMLETCAEFAGFTGTPECMELSVDFHKGYW
eukprot:CAMPEP_0203764304 /NCGR_PEP_ID=MMETSP0098-20131031/17596_1 /ASSEMBLY_ACC=CAM_ASM_000208 /TAXON_ID=96639 /ORGANISM=" , Strain NY0313808BC1" /LENGTH=454 /DNA_ID=CAMNT_0050660109 /DNA_START=49 /DNA_END=1410 /DNA_ORIENTATION=+